MSVLNVIEVLSNSDTSQQDTTSKALKHASKSVKNISSVYIQDQSATVKEDEVANFRVNLKFTFEVN